MIRAVFLCYRQSPTSKLLLSTHSRSNLSPSHNLGLIRLNIIADNTSFIWRLQLMALVPFSLFFLLSVSQSTVKFPIEFFSFCFYHIINTFTITLSSSLAHMQPGGHTLPYASDVFQNVITTLARYTYFCLAIQLSLLTRVCIPFTALAGFTQRFIGAVAVSLPTSASARSSFTRAKFISFLWRCAPFIFDSALRGLDAGLQVPCEIYLR